MKLKKAIEIGTIIVEDRSSPYLADERDAIKLLIEAGKRVEHTRHEAPQFVIPLLPGETNE